MKRVSKAENENLVLSAPRAYLNYLKSMKNRNIPSAEKLALTYALSAIDRSGLAKKKAMVLLTEVETACARIKKGLQAAR